MFHTPVAYLLDIRLPSQSCHNSSFLLCWQFLYGSHCEKEELQIGVRFHLK